MIPPRIAPLLTAATTLALAAPAAAAPDTYVQEVTLEFASEQDAVAAAISIAPLFDDRSRAVSCRWDDNWTSDNEGTRALMEEYGIRGTWYLNDRRFSPDGGDRDYLSVAQSLLVGGNSVGGHSLTHPFLTYFHSNRMFSEMAGCRICWESGLDRPVVSYAYSFVDLRPEPEGREVLMRTLDTLERAGYYHVAEYLSFFDDVDLQHEVSPILPPENRPFEEFKQAVKWAATDKRVGENCPMVCNSMHAWYGTPRLTHGYDELRRRFQLLSELDDVWHCNQNEYAAYRRQYRRARIVDRSTSAREVTLRISRPTLRSINDTTPISIVVEGVDPQSVLRVSSPSAETQLSDNPRPGRSVLHVRHDREQSLPTKIAWTDNPENTNGELKQDSDQDFPYLRGRLIASRAKLELAIENESERPLTEVTVAWRGPIGWQVDAAQSSTLAVPAKERQGYATALRRTANEQSDLGDAMFVAEVDFRHGDEQGRIYYTCTLAGEQPDASWPREGFSVLGPIDDASFDPAGFVRLVESGETPTEWSTKGGTVTWRPRAQDGYVEQEWLNPEYVRTSGSWNDHSENYVVRSRVVSPIARDVSITVSHALRTRVLLNSQLVRDGRAALRKGANDLIIVYPSCKLSPATPRLTACFIRISELGQESPLRDVEFTAPTSLDAAESRLTPEPTYP